MALTHLAKRINDIGHEVRSVVRAGDGISPDSDLYRAHPDWCMHVRRAARALEARQQLILDLSRAGRAATT